MPMEFGIFVQGYIPKWKSAADPDAEHTALMEDLELAKAADKAGFKYVWASEHHFLEEYSHLSANDVFLGYLAHATERIHLGSGIFNPLPQVNHPAKVAERVAMLDHLSGNRFEFGTGRGAGSHEILGFLPGMDDLSGTKEIWEDVIAEFPKMWLQDEYQGYQGKFWSLPPRKILPKPWGPGHPAMWYAAGNTSSYEMAARKGLGVLGFSVGSIPDLEAVLGTYKKTIVNAEPIGAFVNDNVMVTTAAFVSEDSKPATRSSSTPSSTTSRATCSAITTPSLTPKASRTGPSSSPTSTSRRSRPWPTWVRPSWATRTRRSSSAAGGRPPAATRSPSACRAGTSRPPWRPSGCWGARHPENRHRAAAQHHPLPAGGGQVLKVDDQGPYPSRYGPARWPPSITNCAPVQ
jgi:alkanesulfonate monooxygenase SsuD/methylene tetrahydromethanopterin reductase-like flavin-dependent oxidoreductase (luciferase family)